VGLADRLRAAIASFPAREVVLGTLGVIYNLGDVDPGEEEGATELIRRLKAATWDGTDRKVFTLPVALSIMVFFALCAQCASTLVVIGKETASWIWPLVTFVYMTAAGLARSVRDLSDRHPPGLVTCKTPWPSPSPSPPLPGWPRSLFKRFFAPPCRPPGRPRWR